MSSLYYFKNGLRLVK